MVTTFPSQNLSPVSTFFTEQNPPRTTISHLDSVVNIVRFVAHSCFLDFSSSLLQGLIFIWLENFAERYTNRVFSEALFYCFFLLPKPDTQAMQY